MASCFMPGRHSVTVRSSPTAGGGGVEVGLEAVERRAHAAAEHGDASRVGLGPLELRGDEIRGFQEKPQGDDGWINGGFFVLSPKVLSYIAGDSTIWERDPMERLASEGQLRSWFHRGFWQPMDTLRGQQHLEELWASGKALWKTW